MSSAANLDWVFTLAGWALGVGGGGLLLWALFRDRSRGRRRCPRCWYDMGGIPGLVCPECGGDAGREAKLARTRRRWRWAVVAVLVLAAGVGTADWPRVRRAGWVGLVPSSVLVVAAPASTPVAPPPLSAAMARGMPPGSVTIGQGGSVTAVSGSGVWIGTQGEVMVGSGASYTIGSAATVTVPPGRAATITRAGSVTLSAWPPPEPAGVRMHREVWARLEGGRLWGWQAHWYFSRLLAAHPEARPERMLVFPERWPVTRSVSVFARHLPSGYTAEARLPGGAWTPLLARGSIADRQVVALPHGGVALTDPPVEVRFRIAGRTVYARTVPSRLELGGDGASFLERVDSPEATRQVREALHPRLVRSHGRLAMTFRDRDDGPVWGGIEYALFFTVEVRAGGPGGRGAQAGGRWPAAAPSRSGRARCGRRRSWWSWRGKGRAPTRRRRWPRGRSSWWCGATPPRPRTITWSVPSA